jgi:sulfite reductase (NADPH) flavoprotein alpha-component
MSSAVILQGNFPIPDDRRQLLAQLATELNREQLLWLSGYFAGAAAATPSGIPAFQENLLGGHAARAPQAALATVSAVTAAQPAAAAAAAPAPSLTIISASHTNNGRKISEKLLAAVQALGIQARMVKAGDYQPREIAKEKLLYMVISTHGDGDPPDEARGLYEFLGTKRAPQLPELQYGVLSLGDSSYPKFCEAGRVVDERLAKLGAKRLLPRVDCDVDFEKLAQTWADDALARVREHAEKLKPAGGVVFAAAAAAQAPAVAELTRAQPATAEVLANQRIVGRAALREVRHVELSFPGLGNLYKPGDALGIVHRNPERAIEAVLAATRLDAAATVTHDGKTHTLLEWLRDERELTRIARPLLVQVAKQAQVDISELLGNPQAMAQLTATCQVSDVLASYPAEWSAEGLVAALRPVTGRVYSIASSPAAVGDEAHLTVAIVGSDTDRKLLAGAASNFVVNTAADANVQVWIERNERFRVPADGARDIIMIGPGTGVAPFRGFLQEREAAGASGRNWLFYGGRSLYHDFLYQLEWQQAMKRKSLQRLDVAFSRDQAQKIYVQHRLKEAGKELYSWLSNGAYLYVCGDATSMAPDVNAALQAIVAEQGGMDADDAQAWVADLTADGRYLRDVY